MNDAQDPVSGSPLFDDNLDSTSQPAAQPPPTQVDVSKITQTALQNACKRRGLSSSGTKAILVFRLKAAGFKSMDDIRRLSQEYKSDGGDKLASSNVRNKAPNWTRHETARLYHLINSPLHSTTLARLYKKPDGHAELDAKRHDPCANEFADLFNDDEFTSSYKHNLHPHLRQGGLFKARWNKLRSQYTVARDRFSRSGQADADVFTDFTDGDASLAYMHCVFYDSPARNYVVRTLPDEARVEQGIQDLEINRKVDSRRARKRKA